MSIPTAKCIRHSACADVSDTGHMSSIGCQKECKVGVLTQEPSGCPHPETEEWVSSPKSRESVLTQEPRECPHSRAERVSSPLDLLGVLTRVRMPPVDLLSKSCQNNFEAQAEVAVVLHQPLRDPDMTFPGCRTSVPC